jgi:predicted GH43/DUF377 family glycosyl hydrolase
MRIIDIPNESLIANQKAYNCSIIDHGKNTFLYYRFEPPGGTYNTDIAVCELDTKFQPIQGSNKILRLARWSSKVTTMDDPRAFLWRDKINIAFPSGNVVQTNKGWLWATNISFAQFDGGPERIARQWLPKYGRNVNASSKGSSNLIACEKNWTPFVHDNRLFCVYTINPLHIIEMMPSVDQTNTIQLEPEIDLGFWKFGTFLGGGTPLVRRHDEYVGFFHSFTDDHPHKPNCRTYHIGFYAISAKPPFKITRMSRVPLMTAVPNEADDLRGPSSVWRPNCVYPCGFIERHGTVYLSYGWQDCRCKIAEMTWDEITKDVVHFVDGEPQIEKAREVVYSTGVEMKKNKITKIRKPKTTGKVKCK